MTTVQDHLAEIAQAAAIYYDQGDRGEMMTYVNHRLQDHPETMRLAQQGAMLCAALSSGWNSGRLGLMQSIRDLAYLVN